MANEHSGHRDRLRERYLSEGLDGFPPHNVLELLLFYSVPRRDTNVLAHHLIEQFGAKLAGMGFLMELDFLNPREAIAKATDAEVFALVHVE